MELFLISIVLVALILMDRGIRSNQDKMHDKIDETSRLKRRRLQFGLRRLLLSTAVVAVYLGVVKMSGLRPTSITLITLCLVVVGILRALRGPGQAGVLSVVAGAILVGSAACLNSTVLHPFYDPWSATETGLFFGAFFGLAMWGIVEGTCRAVNWADDRMRTKTDGEDHQ